MGCSSSKSKKAELVPAAGVSPAHDGAGPAAVPHGASGKVAAAAPPLASTATAGDSPDDPVAGAVAPRSPFISPLFVTHPAKRTSHPTGDVDDDPVLRQLIRCFAPVVFLHHHEHFNPCSVEWYLERCDLHLKESDKILEKPSPHDPVFISADDHDFLSHRAEHRKETRAGMHLKGPAEVGDIPMYCTVRYFDDLDADFIELRYWFFYAYNGPVLNLGGLQFEQDEFGGTHEGDWEHVTVRIDNVLEHNRPRPDLPPQLVAVLFAAHGHATGRWHQPKTSIDHGAHAFEVVEGNRPVILAAKTSHASYPTVGEQSRGFLPSDYTMKSKKWDTSKYEIIAETSIKDLKDPGRVVRVTKKGTWQQFKGSWGSTKPTLAGAGHGGSPSGPLTKIQAEVPDGVEEAHVAAKKRLMSIPQAFNEMLLSLNPYGFGAADLQPYGH